MSKVITQFNVYIEDETNENEDIRRVISNQVKMMSQSILSEPRVIGALKSPEQHETITVSPSQPPAERRQQRQPSSAKPSSNNPSQASKPATAKQVATVRGICDFIGMPEEDLCERFHVSSLDALDYNQVQEVFDMQKQFKASLG